MKKAQEKNKCSDLRLYFFLTLCYNFDDLNEIVNSSSYLNARVISIFLEINLAQIFALLPLILMPPYNVLAADCLPVQIGDHYE